MAHVIGVIAQKGGVGKSTLSRLIAREFAGQGWAVKIADMDVSQGTCTEWCRLRQQHGIEPNIRVETFGRVGQAMADADRFDLVVIDGAPHATAATLEIARASDLVVIPTGLALDDLRPGVILAHELVEKGVKADKLVFVLNRVGDNVAGIEGARRYITQSGYAVGVTELPERIAYQKAMDAGLAASDTTRRSLNEKAVYVVQDIADRLAVLAVPRDVA